MTKRSKSSREYGPFEASEMRLIVIECLVKGKDNMGLGKLEKRAGVVLTQRELADQVVKILKRKFKDG